MNEQAVPSPQAAPRESFFAAQARYRASARRWTALLATIVAALVVAISALLGPLLYAVAGLLLDLLNLVVPMPDLLGRALSALDALLDTQAHPTLADLAGLCLIAAIPGCVVLGFAWWRLGRIFDARYAEVLALRLGLRDPRTGDFEEQQLRHLVDEMAIAAGHASPRLQLMDSAACNLGVLGEGERAIVIVTRGLLDTLDRAQTQALVGQAIAALGNGDGLLAERLLRLDAMIGLLMLLGQSPLSPGARAALRPLLRFGRTRSEHDLVMLQGVLGNPWILSDENENTWFTGRFRWWRVVLLPLAGSALLLMFLVPIVTMTLLAPLSALLWRRRRLLGDAMAVQFARDPQALGDAYAVLTAHATRPGLDLTGLGSLFVLDAARPTMLRPFPEYPALRKRIMRLNALGARVGLADEPRISPGLKVWAIGGLAALALPPLLAALIVGFAYLSAIFNALLLYAPAVILHAMLR